jgi:hypothetical protein
VKSFLAILGLIIFSCSLAIGQDLRSPNSKFLTKRGYTFPDSTNKGTLAFGNRQWPDTMYYSTMYKSRLLGSLTIPITFNSLHVSNGEGIVSPNVSIGLGYTWFYGDFIFNEDDKMTVDPTFFFGLLGDIGIGSATSFSKVAGFLAGGFIGVGAFTLFGGYDVLNGYLVVGLGARVDFFTFSQKFLHVFGRVHEVRKHKSIAKPITGE